MKEKGEGIGVEGKGDGLRSRKTGREWGGGRVRGEGVGRGEGGS